MDTVKKEDNIQANNSPLDSFSASNLFLDVLSKKFQEKRLSHTTPVEKKEDKEGKNELPEGIEEINFSKVQLQSRVKNKDSDKLLAQLEYLIDIEEKERAENSQFYREKNNIFKHYKDAQNQRNEVFIKENIIELEPTLSEHQQRIIEIENFKKIKEIFSENNGVSKLQELIINNSTQLTTQEKDKSRQNLPKEEIESEKIDRILKERDFLVKNKILCEKLFMRRINAIYKLKNDKFGDLKKLPLSFISYLNKPGNKEEKNKFIGKIELFYSTNSENNNIGLPNKKTAKVSLAPITIGLKMAHSVIKKRKKPANFHLKNFQKNLDEEKHSTFTYEFSDLDTR